MRDKNKYSYPGNPKFKRKLLAAMCTLVIAESALAQAPDDQDAGTDENEAALVEEVIVTGRRAALASAAERKKNAESSLDSILADDAGLLPDASMTESLQRLPGVAIVRFQALGNPDSFAAEGSGVQVRGLSGVAGRLNGREVFSANSGRGLSWGDVTPELMAGVDVYKSATADMIEGGTGGQIDLQTKMPFDHDGFKIAGTASMVHADLSEETTPSASFLVSNRWDTSIGEIGVLLDLAASDYEQRADFIRMEPFYRTKVEDGSGGYVDRFVPGGYDFGSTSYTRERQGAYLGLQWAPTDTLSFSQTIFYSEYEDLSTSRGLFVVSKQFSVDPDRTVFDSNGVFVSTDNGIFQRDVQTFEPLATQAFTSGGNTGVSAGTSKTLDVSTEFVWDVNDRLTLKGAIQATDSEATRSNYDVFPGVPFPSQFSMDISGSLPQVVLSDAAGANFADPAQYEWQATMDHIEDNDGSLRSVNLDANYELSDTGFFRSAQVGFRYAEREEIDNNSGYNWTALGRGWDGTEENSQRYFSDAVEGDVEQNSFDNFFRGDANLPGNTLMPSLAMVERRDVVRDHTVYGGLPVEPIGFHPDGLDRLEQQTNNTALYGLVRIGGEVGGLPYSGNIGVRFVEIENISTGYFAQATTTAFKFQDSAEAPDFYLAPTSYFREGGSTFRRGLPNINLSLDPSEEWKIRFAYGVTLDQPSFSALKATGTLNVRTTETRIVDPVTDELLNSWRLFQEYTTDSGAPELQPVISRNTDLSFEWYPSDSTSGHIALFHKSLDNWILYNETLTKVDVTLADGPEAGNPTYEIRPDQDASTTVAANSEQEARVQGFEIGGRTFFDALPSPWDGLGIEANYTYIDSKNPGNTYTDIDGQQYNDAPIEGLSDNNFNFTLMYEKGPVSLRAAYSWRDQYLMSTNSNGTNGDYNYWFAPGAATADCANESAYCENINISLPVYSDDFGQVDVGGSYRFTDNLLVSLQISNLTDAVPKTLQGGYPNGELLPRSWFLYDRRAELIFNVTF